MTALTSLSQPTCPPLITGFITRVLDSNNITRWVCRSCENVAGFTFVVKMGCCTLVSELV